LPHLAVGATASLRGLIALVVPGELIANRLNVDCASVADLGRTGYAIISKVR
jgi:hypothetical protein